jgi:hypothetical protein
MRGVRFRRVAGTGRHAPGSFGRHVARSGRQTGRAWSRRPAGIPPPGPVLILFAAAFFVLSFAAKTLLRLHDEPLWPRHSRGHGTIERL